MSSRALIFADSREVWASEDARPPDKRACLAGLTEQVAGEVEDPAAGLLGERFLPLRPILPQKRSPRIAVRGCAVVASRVPESALRITRSKKP